MPPVKIASYEFKLEGEGAADGMKFHKSGLIVSTCPGGLCIIRPVTNYKNSFVGKEALLAHIKFKDNTKKVFSNVVFGRTYMYITGTKSLWRIPLAF